MNGKLGSAGWARGEGHCVSRDAVSKVHEFLEVRDTVRIMVGDSIPSRAHPLKWSLGVMPYGGRLKATIDTERNLDYGCSRVRALSQSARLARRQPRVHGNRANQPQ